MLTVSTRKTEKVQQRARKKAKKGSSFRANITVTTLAVYTRVSRLLMQRYRIGQVSYNLLVFGVDVWFGSKKGFTVFQACVHLFGNGDSGADIIRVRNCISRLIAAGLLELAGKIKGNRFNVYIPTVRVIEEFGEVLPLFASEGTES